LIVLLEIPQNGMILGFEIKKNQKEKQSSLDIGHTHKARKYIIKDEILSPTPETYF
jgi:uncharacterized protein YuzE